MKTTFFLVLICLPFTTLARNGNLTGTVRSQQGNMLEATSVLVLKAADSSLVKTGVTDAEGKYAVEDLPDGSYLVRVNHVVQPVTIQGANVQVPDIVMNEAKKEIKEITVRAQKPLIEARADRIIVNVENSIVNTGSTVLEVLQRSPGVNVDHNDNISLKGKQGVNIMIDGKLVPVQGTDLANMLKSMPANSVEKIELISNPGARYDAAGTAGIINIKTKKDKRSGTNGSVTGGFGQGIYPKANGGFNLNYRNKKLNVYANYNTAYREGKNELILYRQFDSNQKYQLAYDQHNYAKIDSRSHVATAGVDYNLSSKTNIGMILSGSTTSYLFNSNNAAALINPDREVFSYFYNTTQNDNKFNNYGVNLNLRHSFDSAGRELSVDADYARYNNHNNQHLYTRYRNVDGIPLGAPDMLYGKLKGNTDIRSFKADYVHPLKNNARIEVGMKTSFVKADNDPAFYDQSTGYDIYDSAKSNHFIYKENINALYVNANKDWKKWSVQLGLRAEQTIADGHQLVNDSKFEKDYISLFPSLAVTHHLDEKNDLGINLGRRIDRPNYRQLNPFRDYLDPTSIHEGNPYLNPSFTYTAELSHIYKSRFITQLTYSHTTDVITQVIVPSGDNITLITDRNLATNTIYSLNGSYPFQVFKWWNSTNYIGAFYSHFNGDIANTPLSAGTFAATFSTQNSFVLPKEWSLELSGWFELKQRYGYMVLKDMSGINIGAQKNFFDKKLTVRVNVTDLMLKQNPVGSSEFTGYHEDFIVRRDTRTANIAVTYRFGKRAVPPARKRQRGAEDELKRAGSNGA